MNDIVDRTQEREELMWENWRKQQESRNNLPMP